MADILTFERRDPADKPAPKTPREAVAAIFPTVTMGSIDYFLIKLWALGYKVVPADE